ncbi:uncharacterized protein PSFLO_07771 [Pseudozyma flocculosa]|uniref:Uncharacterized protein n=1 Tax=Pseudozyma flocculosa TaxID=84751 RepID=A0A5C3FD52_9BASI|nr:uncharacterized protein PSFLO_07771 [Pseudozyma flocculosa]
MLETAAYGSKSIYLLHLAVLVWWICVRPSPSLHAGGQPALQGRINGRCSWAAIVAAAAAARRHLESAGTKAPELQGGLWRHPGTMYHILSQPQKGAASTLPPDPSLLCTIPAPSLAALCCPRPQGGKPADLPASWQHLLAFLWQTRLQDKTEQKTKSSSWQMQDHGTHQVHQRAGRKWGRGVRHGKAKEGRREEEDGEEKKGKRKLQHLGFPRGPPPQY